MNKWPVINSVVDALSIKEKPSMYEQAPFSDIQQFPDKLWQVSRYKLSDGGGAGMLTWHVVLVSEEQLSGLPIVYNHFLFLQEKSAFSFLNLLFYNKYTKVVWNSCFNDLDFFYFHSIFLQCSTIDYCLEYHNFIETSLAKTW